MKGEISIYSNAENIFNIFVFFRSLDSEVAGGMEVSFFQVQVLQVSAAIGDDLNIKISTAMLHLPKEIFVIELKWEDNMEYIKH